jgi:methylated-DNA-[protein]-cysteine S-methyltransferase
MTSKTNSMIEISLQNNDNFWFGVACDKQEIFASSFSESQERVLNNILNDIPFNVPFQVFHEPSTFAKTILVSLKSIYDGQEISRDFPLAITSLPAYTQAVLKATAKIPIGYLTTYGSIAKAVGGGPRAVGNIMASNPFAPIVPCHRVVKSDFTLGGYGGGLKTKIELLLREKRGFSAPKQLQVAGNLLQIFPVEYAVNKLLYCE